MEAWSLAKAKLKLNLFFLISLSLHLGVIGLFWFFTLSPEKPMTETSVEIELIPHQHRATLPTSVSSATAKSGSKGQRSRADKKQLVQKLLAQTFTNGSIAMNNGSRSRQAEGSWSENSYTTDDDSNVAWGAGGGTFERIQDLTIMKRIYDKVDALLFYPMVLAHNKIDGTVNARIVLNQQGSCEWPLTKISNGETHLRLYVMHLLKKLCDENFKAFLKDRTNTNIDMSFRFAITEKPTTKELIDENQKVLGNVMLFYRNSHQSVAQWHLGPFTGMFPIPIVTLDFDWVLLNFEKYVNHRDPMREYRE